MKIKLTIGFSAMLLVVSFGAFGRGGMCPPNVGPDVIVGEIIGVRTWGSVGTIGGYSLGTTSCNIGDAVLPWIAASNQHPVIAQSMYRIKDGRIEQIGIGWLKHGFFAVNFDFCCTCTFPGTSTALGVGCADPYSSSLNGDQDGTVSNTGGLGPRFEVNPATGAFNWPYSFQGMAGDEIYKRIQVPSDDLDPFLNIGAIYLGETQYITPDDSLAGNANNNVSYATFTNNGPVAGAWSLTIGPTVPMQPAIQAWQDFVPDVTLVNVDVPSDGRMILGYRVTDNQDGTWHYEYAIYNMNSHRAAQDFRIPIASGALVTNIGFRDINYHSGEPFDPTDWSAQMMGNEHVWSTIDFVTDPNANALRWGTLYNFRFDANAPPQTVSATIGLFRSGAPNEMNVTTLAPRTPGDANGDQQVNIMDLLAVLGAWGNCPMPCPPNCPADVNDDCTVNVIDLLTVLGNWG